MRHCDICGEEVEFVTKCKSCDERFCIDCGEIESKECVYCQEGKEVDEDHDEDDEDGEGDDNW